MSKEPNRNVYVGHRYVPLILEEWDNKISYEGLSVVTYQGASYTSKKRVPAGIDILNKEFWSLTGNYNAQVEYYRDETERVSEKLDSKSDQTYVDTELGKKADTSFVNTELGKKSDQTYVDTELGKKANQTYVDTELGKKSDQTYVDTELGKKSDQTYVDTELGKKSDITDVDIINNNEVYVESYPKLSNEVSDSGRIQRAINEAGLYGTIIFENKKTYDITGSLKLLSFQTLKGNGTRLVGDQTNTAILIEGNSESSTSRLLIEGMSFIDFDIGIKLTSNIDPPHGSYYSNFMYNRFVNCRIGYDLGRNSNMNNVFGNTFQRSGEAGVYIRNGAYKNNIIGNTLEGNEDSTGVISHGGDNLIMGNYFEWLDTAINSIQGTTIEMGNYFNSNITTPVTENPYTMSLTNDTDYYPSLKLGNTSIKGTRTELLFNMADDVTRMVIPKRIRNTSGGLDLLYDKPQINLNDTSDNGKGYVLRSTNGELETRNNSEKVLTKLSNDGHFSATNGIHGGRFTVENRPVNVPAGTIIVDANSDKIIFWNGGVWKDAMGETV